MLELFFAFLFLLLIAAAFPFLVLFDTYRSVRTAPRAAHALARGAARSASRNTARSVTQAPAHRAARIATRRTTRRTAPRTTRDAASVPEPQVARAAARNAASDTACSVAGKREELRANPSAPGDLQRCA